MSRSKFFSTISYKHNNKLSQSQVDGYEAILDVFEKHPELTIPMKAYILATVFHETAHTIQAIAEYGKGSTRVYGQWKTNSKGVKYCVKDGSRKTVYTQADYPYLYYGRGHVQLTWWTNYKRMGDKLGYDLVNNPDLMLDNKISIEVLISGMVDGDFTGRKLANYFRHDMKDYINARKIINGTDSAHTIAGHARAFEQALTVL